MWKPISVDDGFDELCHSFYNEKTMNRLDLFLSKRDESFKEKHIVNGVSIDSINKLLLSWSIVVEICFTD